MLTELCKELNNWFEREKYSGTFTIEGGNITAPVLLPGQYFRIIGSIFNDGVHCYPAQDLTPETFNGSIWALAIPTEVIRLSDEIDAYRRKYESVDSAAMSPFTSESFGGYSYTKGGGGNSSGGANSGRWQSVYASSLRKWRKLK